MCSAFIPNCGFDISTINFIGDVFCPKTECSGKLCLNKKTFHSLDRSDYHCPQCTCVYQLRSTPFEDQTNSLFLSFGQGVFLEERPNSIQVVKKYAHCPSQYCFNREKYESSDSYVITPRSLYGCGKYGACLFVHKFPYTLQEHVDTTKTEKNTRFFFAKKKMNLLADKQLLLNVPFQSTKYRRENCVWTTKCKRLLEICIVPRVEMKSVFTFQPKND